MSIGIILIAFFSIIALLVLHEFGHFITAKRFGVRVEEFGVGYPPRLIGKKFGETLYSINLLPFGAFVKIYGEEGGIEDYRSFTGKPLWQRALIILGGVVSFWIISFILLSIVFGMGVSQAVPDAAEEGIKNPRVQIMGVSPDSPAKEAGLEPGDVVKKISFEGEEFLISKVKDIQSLSEKYKGKEIALEIERGGNIFSAFLMPRVSPPPGEKEIGVELIRVAEKSFPWWQAPIKGAETTANLTVSVIAGLGMVLESLAGGGGLPEGVQLVGPVGVGSMIARAAEVGIGYFLYFIALISVYLAVFNILPIPALDGGKLVFLAIEKIKGSAVNPKVEQGITAGFFVVLLILMIVVTTQDISRII